MNKLGSSNAFILCYASIGIARPSDGSPLTLDVFADEEVVHDVPAVVVEDLLELADVVVLVGHDEVGHGQDLGVVLVRLGFLRVERVDVRLHQPGETTRRDGKTWKAS